MGISHHKLVLVQRLRVAVGGGFARRRGGPVDGVPNRVPHVGIVVRGVGLVAGAEVEDPAAPPLVAAAAPENLPSSEPAHEDELLGWRYVEGLAVHLLLQLDVLPQTLDYRVPWCYHPEPLAVVVAPLQVAARAHEPLEDLGEVPGVEHYKAHATEHLFVDPLDNLVGDLAVGYVSPPEKHVRRVEDLLCEAVIGLVEGGSPDLEVIIHERRQSTVNTVRIDLRDLLIAPFVSVLIPNRDVRGIHH